MLHDMPVAETYLPTPIFVLVRFHRWDDVLKLSPPDATMAMTTAFWHFARGSAFAAEGKMGMAETERRILESTRKQISADLEFSFYGNKAQAFLELAANILDARMAAAHGENEQAIKYWEKAVEIEDTLYYGEPPECIIRSVSPSVQHCSCNGSRGSSGSSCFALISSSIPEIPGPCLAS